MHDPATEDWRRLVVNLTRCQHGRVQLDNCVMCPGGISPDQSGRVVGYSLDGTYAVTIPTRIDMAKPEAWYVPTRPEAE